MTVQQMSVFQSGSVLDDQVQLGNLFKEMFDADGSILVLIFKYGFPPLVAVQRHQICHPTLPVSATEFLAS
ncbi:hypothetical protein [Mesorhizobium sp. CO1-1-8]|uniref:hypothetical protein n=1 Tax=Mesorhizobium sp. CO1-1-8 TaxID=2876631 RepID=UPI001CD0EF16|nr:hypothetical protein [Mesorhizobium sp. CO1-1-8]MBZ9774985.1 hypothetical protein [Mesorhizobium sp. CO1-1-8]